MVALDANLATVDLDGGPEHLEDGVGEAAGAGGGDVDPEEHGELVAAETGGDAAVADDRSEPVSGLLQ